MKRLIMAILALALSGPNGAAAADAKVLRRLTAPPPIQLQPLAPDAQPRAVSFARLVIHPADGEAWALAYDSFYLRGEDSPPARNELLTWDRGRMDAQTDSFGRAFDDELQKAGFKGSGGKSLFDEDQGSADLKVGVLIDDIKGRFCLDCPNILNSKGIPATVVMSAKWEVYSSLERKVVARISTSGGANSKAKVQGSVIPAVLEGFRENVRLLMASPEFQAAVLTQAAAVPPSAAAAPAFTPIALRPASGATPVAQASKAVAVVFAADGAGSGFLVSDDGYLLTNHHVVGGSKFVKLKWSDGSEALGEVVRSDRRRDIALIKTDAKGRAPLSLRLAAPDLGEAVYAVGAPLGEQFQNTMTKGIVSASRTVEGQPFIQSDVTINGGNSGGPLLDDKGAVIGVAVTSVRIGGAGVGLNFFIPIADALKTLAITPAPGG